MAYCWSQGHFYKKIRELANKKAEELLSRGAHGNFTCAWSGILFMLDQYRQRNWGFIVGYWPGEDNSHDRKTYREFMNSDHWQNVRKRKLEEVSSCENCGTLEKLEIHHLHYMTYGNERNCDLKVLCRNCHQAEHDITPNRRDIEAYYRGLFKFAQENYGDNWWEFYNPEDFELFFEGMGCDDCDSDLCREYWSKGLNDPYGLKNIAL